MESNIIDEVRAVRHELAEAHGNDITRIVADLRRREAASLEAGWKFVESCGPQRRHAAVEAAAVAPNLKPA